MSLILNKLEFGADLSTYVNFEIKPNLPVLGKAYGKMIPGIRKEHRFYESNGILHKDK